VRLDARAKRVLTYRDDVDRQSTLTIIELAESGCRTFGQPTGRVPRAILGRAIALACETNEKAAPPPGPSLCVVG
jgi:hypothetical protein